MTTTLTQFPLNSFDAYKEQFAYQGDDLYRLLFDRNRKLIKSKKPENAVPNLRRIFEATFKLSAQIGFHEMSLRDLSRETEISMGGLYSCLSKKEDIALMVLDIVELVTNENIELAKQQFKQQGDELTSIEMALRYHLYASTLLQPWFFFLYFETRCLSAENQARSKAIELNSIAMLEQKIQQGSDAGKFDVNSPYFVAHTILSVLQDWYLKPWKNKQKNIQLDDYSNYLLVLVKKLLQVESSP